MSARIELFSVYLYFVTPPHLYSNLIIYARLSNANLVLLLINNTRHDGAWKTERYKIQEVKVISFA